MADGGADFDEYSDADAEPMLIKALEQRKAKKDGQGRYLYYRGLQRLRPILLACLGPMSLMNLMSLMIVASRTGNQMNGFHHSSLAI